MVPTAANGIAVEGTILDTNFEATEIRRLHDRLRVLSETMHSFAEATVDYPRLLETIARKLSEVIKDSCVLSIVSDDASSLTPVSIHASTEEAVRKLRALLEVAPVKLKERSVMEGVFRTGAAVLLPVLDFEQLAQQSMPAYVEFLEDLGAHSVLAVALRTEGRSIGVLTLLRYRPESPPFDERDLELAQILAEHAALAITNAQLISSRNQAEARFRCLSDAGILGVVVTDMTGRVLEINDTLVRLLGHSRDDLLSGRTPWSTLTPPTWAEVDTRAREQLRDTNVAGLREKELVAADGRHVPVLVGSAMFDRASTRVISFVLDLTDRKLAEATARERNDRFRALVENNADGIALSAAAGTFLYVSPAAGKILGRDPEEIVGTRFTEYLHPDDLAAAAEQRRGMLAKNGRDPPIVRRVVRPDGAVRWVEVTATNMLHNPAIRAIVSSIRDITDERAAERALAIVKHRFTALFESGIMGIIVADVAGEVLEANDTYLSMIGYTREDLEAGLIDWKKLTPPEWEAWNAETIAEVAATGRGTPREKEYVRKDGSRVPVLVGVAKVEDRNTVAVSIDLTARKLAEAARANLEVQLRQSQKMDAVGRLAGGVAHDFNNMLSVILSYADLLLGSLGASDPIRADLQEILKAGNRAADLTRQLLMFSRQQVIAPRVVDLNAVLRDMNKMLQRVLGEDIDLVASTENAVGGVLVDPSGMEQVVLNLVVNARDAMPTGGKLLLETANVVLDEQYSREHVEVKPGRYVMLAVTDTGAGMDKATQARIFEPFFTTKAVGKGTGLGLSTVFGIVKQSGGSVWVYSEPTRGTTFKVYLPRVDSVFDTIDTRPTAPHTLRGVETILLVEDEDQVRHVALGILSRQGYRVLEARNAGEAFLICGSHQTTIHLLLSDVVMPQMSGPELAKRLALARPEMKVLCMSGYTDESIVRHGVLEARFAFLQKPITPETLLRKVREVLDALPAGAHE